MVELWSFSAHSKSCYTCNLWRGRNVRFHTYNANVFDLFEFGRIFCRRAFSKPRSRGNMRNIYAPFYTFRYSRVSYLNFLLRFEIFLLASFLMLKNGVRKVLLQANVLFLYRWNQFLSSFLYSRQQ